MTQSLATLDPFQFSNQTLWHTAQDVRRVCYLASLQPDLDAMLDKLAPMRAVEEMTHPVMFESHFCEMHY